MRYFSHNPINFWDETRTIDTINIYSLQDLLNRSKATDEFKDAVRNFIDTPTPNSVIRYAVGMPGLKILRTIMKLLEMRPDLEIEAVAITARSGCADFVGTIEVQPGTRKFAFVWNCQWRARENEIQNAWGMPDQIKAANDFGYQCFQSFGEITNE